MAVHGDRTGFVHQPRAVRETQQRHRPAAAVAVPRPGLDVDEQMSVRPAREPRLRQGRLVGGEAVQQFGEGVGRVEADPAEEAGEDRMGRQQLGEALPLPRPPQELPEPGPAVVAGEPARLSCPVQFGHEDAGGDPGQSRPDRPDQSGADGGEVDEPPLGAAESRRHPLPRRLGERCQHPLEPAETFVPPLGRGEDRRCGGEHPLDPHRPVRRLPGPLPRAQGR